MRVFCGLAAAAAMAVGGCGGGEDKGGGDEAGKPAAASGPVSAADFKTCAHDAGAQHQPASDGDDVGKALRDEGLTHEALALAPEGEDTNSFVRVFPSEDEAKKALEFVKSYSGSGAEYNDSTKQQANVTYFPYLSEAQGFVDGIVQRCAP